MLNVISGVHGTPVPPVTNSYESIATVDVGSGGSSTITFSSIPSTYKHLQIRAISRLSDAGSSDNWVSVALNSDTGANYYRHRLYGSGASVGAEASANRYLFTVNQNGTTANSFTASVVDLLDYSSTSKNKTIRSLAGWDTNGSGYMTLNSTLWMSTSAVTSVTLSANFAQYSSFALYGIKG